MRTLIILLVAAALFYTAFKVSYLWMAIFWKRVSGIFIKKIKSLFSYPFLNSFLKKKNKQG